MKKSFYDFTDIKKVIAKPKELKRRFFYLPDHLETFFFSSSQPREAQ